MTHESNAQLLEDPFAVLRAADPVAWHDLPDPRSPAGATLRTRLEGALFPEAARPRLGRRFLAMGAAAAAVAVAVALLPARVADDGGLPGAPQVVARALAAVSSGPVVHAIVEPTGTAGSVGGAVEATRTEYWYDEEHQALRVRLHAGGRVLAELVQTPEGAFTEDGRLEGSTPPPFLHPALSGFVTRYREALASGDARLLGEATVDDARGLLMRLALPSRGGVPPELRPSTTAEVLLDSDTYRPLRFRSLPNPRLGEIAGGGRWFRVVALESVARAPDLFAPPAVR